MTPTQPDLVVLDGGASKASTTKKKGWREPQKIGEFEVPFSYEVWGDGVYRITAPTPDDHTVPSIHASPSSERRTNLQALTHQPIWIRRMGHVLDTNEQLLELAFRDPVSETVQFLWADRYQVASKQAITQLARRGLPVTEGNAPAIITFLDAGLNKNGARLECVKVLRRSGAHQIAEGLGWLLGERWIGPPNTRVAPDPRGRIPFTRGFVVNGDSAEWFEMFKTIARKGALARWLIYSTFAPPLLRLVNQRTFVIHHWGMSGSGKSAVAKFAMSAWGDPSALSLSFNRTNKSFTEVFEYLSDVPVLYDELQAADRDGIAQIIYWLCQERKRGRTTTTGGLLDEGGEGWKSIVRTTGEEPLIGQGGTVDLGGEANRVVQIGVPLFQESFALEVHQWCERRHFGWGGIRFLESLVNAMQAAGESFPALIKERYDALNKAILSRVSTAPVHARMAHLTVVALATYLANRWLFQADPEMAFEGAVSDAVAVADTIAIDEIREPLAEQALQLINDHFQSRRQFWFDLSNPEDDRAVLEGRYKGLFGVLTDSEVWLVQREANQLLLKAGLPPRRVWSDLRRMGMLYTPPSSGGSYGTPRKYGKFYAKVYVLSRRNANKQIT